MPSLVIQLARMGDLLQTKRLLISLAQDDDVHLLVDHSLAAFARKIYPFAVIHEIAAHNSRTACEQPEPGNSEHPAQSESEIQLRRLTGCSGLLQRIFPALTGLRTYNFSRVYNLNYSGLNLALSTLWEASKLRGYWLDRGQEMRSFWLDFAFRWAAQRRSAPVNLMDLWGMLAPYPIEAGQVNPAALARGGGLGIMLGGRMARRSIPPQLWAAHIGIVCQRMGWPEVTLFGTKDEQPLAREVLCTLPAAILSKTRNLAGKTGLSDLAGEISRLDRLLTPDTGGMHLAAHFGVPVEAFFLSSAWVHETGPYGEGHIIWQAIAPCLPCLEVRRCPHSVQCLAVFSKPEFMKLLSHFPAGSNKPGGRGAMPAGLLCLKSGFDRLGVVYSNALLPHHDHTEEITLQERQRAELRRLAANCNAEKLKGSAPAGNTADDNSVYESFFRESDWMLPKQE